MVHVASPDDDEFCQLISAADALISLRRTSVGESSGPVVQAHRLHKPVVGLRVGSLPELCGPGDVLLDATADASDLFAAAIAAGLADLASGAPQIPDPAAVATAMLALYDEVGLGR